MISILKRNNVSIIGDGEETILFAHGFGCDQNVWRHIVNALKSDYKIILFDYVGAGNSDLSAYNSEKYATLNGYAHDVLDVCKALDLKDIIFVGHSVSSMVGVRAALLQPELFSQLIFVTPSPSYINDGNYNGGMNKQDLEDLLDMMDNNYLGWSSSIAPLVMGNAERPELGEELTANFCSTNPSIAKEFARVTFLSDSRDDLNKLTVPSLTIQCQNDMLVPPSIGIYIQQHAANNTLTILNSTGHCPHLSAPQETVDAIKNYLNTQNVEWSY
jgi:sigma-B regulation protein RsbQ